MSFVIIIEDDRALCKSLELQLKDEGHEVKYANRGDRALEILEDADPDLILLDLGLPDCHGLDLLEEVRDRGCEASVVVITGQQDMKAAINAMRLGAFDYIRKPFDIEEVLLALEKIERFRKIRLGVSQQVAVESTDTPRVDLDSVDSQEKSYEIVGSHRKILEVVKRIGLLSRERITILVEGESGTGKELVARALHEASAPGQPFVAINCSAVVPTLLESELFGHEKGAFTGAEKRKIGKLEFAESGTVFLDEIGEMSLDLQAKVLRVLQEEVFERVGGVESKTFKARVVAATNRDLEELVKEKKFRKDLFYRLAVARIKVPALHERRSDVPSLVKYLLERIGTKMHQKIGAVEEEAIRLLTAYDWPGNVRELENVLTRSVALSRNPEVISAEDVERSLSETGTDTPLPTEIVPLSAVELAYVEKALMAFGWNVAKTAKALQISPTTLRKKMSDGGLQKNESTD